MTRRMIVSIGLIAGLTQGEIYRAQPGYIMDLYIYRRRYDDQQHGIRREREPACAD